MAAGTCYSKKCLAGIARDFGHHSRHRVRDLGEILSWRELEQRRYYQSRPSTDPNWSLRLGTAPDLLWNTSRNDRDGPRSPRATRYIRGGSTVVGILD